MIERFIDEPSALVTGAPAWLLSRVLDSPGVAAVLSRAPVGVDPADLAETLEAIRRAGRAYAHRCDQQQRDNATATTVAVPHCLTTEQAAEYLKLSRRRVQELAPELNGHRIGRRWLIPEVTVHQLAERTRAGNAA